MSFDEVNFIRTLSLSRSVRGTWAERSGQRIISPTSKAPSGQSALNRPTSARPIGSSALDPASGLGQPVPMPALTKVVAGDSLWAIAERRLEADGIQATNAAILDYVNRMWAENERRLGGGNPDLIHVGALVLDPALAEGARNDPMTAGIPYTTPTAPEPSSSYGSGGASFSGERAAIDRPSQSSDDGGSSAVSNGPALPVTTARPQGNSAPPTPKSTAVPPGADPTMYFSRPAEASGSDPASGLSLVTFMSQEQAVRNAMRDDERSAEQALALAQGDVDTLKSLGVTTVDLDRLLEPARKALDESRARRQAFESASSSEKAAQGKLAEAESKVAAALRDKRAAEDAQLTLMEASAVPLGAQDLEGARLGVVDARRKLLEAIAWRDLYAQQIEVAKAAQEASEAARVADDLRSLTAGLVQAAEREGDWRHVYIADSTPQTSLEVANHRATRAAERLASEQVKLDQLLIERFGSDENGELLVRPVADSNGGVDVDGESKRAQSRSAAAASDLLQITERLGHDSAVTQNAIVRLGRETQESEFWETQVDLVLLADDLEKARQVLAAARLRDPFGEATVAAEQHVRWLEGKERETRVSAEKQRQSMAALRSADERSAQEISTAQRAVGIAQGQVDRAKANGDQEALADALASLEQWELKLDAALAAQEQVNSAFFNAGARHAYENASLPPPSRDDRPGGSGLGTSDAPLELTSQDKDLLGKLISARGEVTLSSGVTVRVANGETTFELGNGRKVVEVGGKYWIHDVSSSPGRGVRRMDPRRMDPFTERLWVAQRRELLSDERQAAVQSRADVFVPMQSFAPPPTPQPLGTVELTPEVSEHALRGVIAAQWDLGGLGPVPDILRMQEGALREGRWLAFPDPAPSSPQGQLGTAIDLNTLAEPRIEAVIDASAEAASLGMPSDTLNVLIQEESALRAVSVAQGSTQAYWEERAAAELRQHAGEPVCDPALMAKQQALDDRTLAKREIARFDEARGELAYGRAHDAHTARSKDSPDSEGTLAEVMSPTWQQMQVARQALGDARQAADLAERDAHIVENLEPWERSDPEKLAELFNSNQQSAAVLARPTFNDFYFNRGLPLTPIALNGRQQIEDLVTAALGEANPGVAAQIEKVGGPNASVAVVPLVFSSDQGLTPTVLFQVETDVGSKIIDGRGWSYEDRSDFQQNNALPPEDSMVIMPHAGQDRLDASSELDLDFDKARIESGWEHFRRTNYVDEGVAVFTLGSGAVLIATGLGAPLGAGLVTTASLGLAAGSGYGAYSSLENLQQMRSHGQSMNPIENPAVRQDQLGLAASLAGLGAMGRGASAGRMLADRLDDTGAFIAGRELSEAQYLQFARRQSQARVLGWAADGFDAPAIAMGVQDLREHWGEMSDNQKLLSLLLTGGDVGTMTVPLAVEHLSGRGHAQTEPVLTAQATTPREDLGVATDEVDRHESGRPPAEADLPGWVGAAPSPFSIGVDEANPPVAVPIEPLVPVGADSGGPFVPVAWGMPFIPDAQMSIGEGSSGEPREASTGFGRGAEPRADDLPSFEPSTGDASAQTRSVRGDADTTGPRFANADEVLLGRDAKKFRRDVQRAIASDPDHLLRFLLTADGSKFRTPKSRAHDQLADQPWIVEMGHVISKKTGLTEYFVLQMAWENQYQHVSIENPNIGGAVLDRPIISIGGIAVSKETAEAWEKVFGLLPAGTVASAPRVLISGATGSSGDAPRAEGNADRSTGVQDELSQQAPPIAARVGSTEPPESLVPDAGTPFIPDARGIPFIPDAQMSIGEGPSGDATGMDGNGSNASPFAPVVGADVVLGTRLAEPMGSTTAPPSGLWLGKDGQVRYVKRYSDPEQALDEALANEIYRRLGVPVPNSRLIVSIDQNGATQALIVNDWVENSGMLGVPAQVTEELGREVLQNLVADAWLANWDVVGMAGENVVTTPHGLLRIDQGGALRFRAKGGRKTEDALMSADLNEFWRSNPSYASLLGELGYSVPDDVPSLTEQLARIQHTADWAGGIDELVEQAAGVVRANGTWEFQNDSITEIARLLQARLSDLERQILGASGQAFVPPLNSEQNLPLRTRAVPGTSGVGEGAAPVSDPYMDPKTAVTRPKNLDWLPANHSYRGDSRPYSEIFENGFTARGSNADLREHVYGDRSHSGFISTSRSYDWVRDNVRAPFVYVVHPFRGVEVSALPGLKGAWVEREQEIAIPQRIDPRSIRAVILTAENRSILNPNYDPNYRPSLPVSASVPAEVPASGAISKVVHPERNSEAGDDVIILNPTTGTPVDEFGAALADPYRIATVTPGTWLRSTFVHESAFANDGPFPRISERYADGMIEVASIAPNYAFNGVYADRIPIDSDALTRFKKDFRNWTDAQWSAFAAPFIKGKWSGASDGSQVDQAGVIATLNGKIVLVEPTNGFGSAMTLPKGRVDGLSPLVAAFKQAWDEAGLLVTLGHAEPVKGLGGQSYFPAEVVYFSGVHIGWESQAVHFVPKHEALDTLSMSGDPHVGSLVALEHLLSDRAWADVEEIATAARSGSTTSDDADAPPLADGARPSSSQNASTREEGGAPAASGASVPGFSDPATEADLPGGKGTLPSASSLGVAEGDSPVAAPAGSIEPRESVVPDAGLPFIPDAWGIPFIPDAQMSIGEGPSIEPGDIGRDLHAMPQGAVEGEDVAEIAPVPAVASSGNGSAQPPETPKGLLGGVPDDPERVFPSGEKVDEPNPVVASGPEEATDPAGSLNAVGVEGIDAEDFLAQWATAAGIGAARTQADGARGTGEPIDAEDFLKELGAAAIDAEDFLAQWATAAEIGAARTQPEGAQGTGEPIDAEDFLKELEAAAFDAEDFLAQWATAAGIGAARTQTDGARGTGEPIDAEDFLKELEAAAIDAGDFLAQWAAAAEIDAARTQPEVARGMGEPIAAEDFLKELEAAAIDAEDFLVQWAAAAETGAARTQPDAAQGTGKPMDAEDFIAQWMAADGADTSTTHPDGVLAREGILRRVAGTLARLIDALAGTGRQSELAKLPATFAVSGEYWPGLRRALGTHGVSAEGKDVVYAYLFEHNKPVDPEEPRTWDETSDTRVIGYYKFGPHGQLLSTRWTENALPSDSDRMDGSTRTWIVTTAHEPGPDGFGPAPGSLVDVPWADQASLRELFGYRASKKRLAALYGTTLPVVAALATGGYVMNRAGVSLTAPAALALSYRLLGWGLRTGESSLIRYSTWGLTTQDFSSALDPDNLDDRALWRLEKLLVKRGARYGLPESASTYAKDLETLKTAVDHAQTDADRIRVLGTPDARAAIERLSMALDSVRLASFERVTSAQARPFARRVYGLSGDDISDLNAAIKSLRSNPFDQVAQQTLDEFSDHLVERSKALFTRMTEHQGLFGLTDEQVALYKQALEDLPAEPLSALLTLQDPGLWSARSRSRQVDDIGALLTLIPTSAVFFNQLLTAGIGRAGAIVGATAAVVSLQAAESTARLLSKRFRALDVDDRDMAKLVTLLQRLTTIVAAGTVLRADKERVMSDPSTVAFAKLAANAVAASGGVWGFLNELRQLTGKKLAPAHPYLPVALIIGGLMAGLLLRTIEEGEEGLGAFTSTAATIEELSEILSAIQEEIPTDPSDPTDPTINMPTQPGVPAGSTTVTTPSSIDASPATAEVDRDPLLSDAFVVVDAESKGVSSFEAIARSIAVSRFGVNPSSDEVQGVLDRLYELNPQFDRSRADGRLSLVSGEATRDPDLIYPGEEIRING